MSAVFPIFPMGDRLFVKRLEARNMIGGIHIPSEAQEKPLYGKVVCVGRGVEADELQSSTIVLYGRYAGTEVKVLNEDYLLLREDEVMGVVVDRATAMTLVDEGA